MGRTSAADSFDESAGRYRGLRGGKIVSLADSDLAALRTVKRILKAGDTLPLAEAQAVERAEFPKLWVAEAHTKAARKFLGGKIPSTD